MPRHLMRLLAMPLAALSLAGCETTNGSDWVENDPSVPFDDAESTCEEQTESIENEENRPEFFTDCIVALGWTPKPGTTFSTPWDAPDPS